jgi:hypothetical protein
MNYVENLKSTQLRKLFKIFKSSSMQSLNIFWSRESFLFEFATLCGVWKIENRFLLGWALLSAVRCRFHRAESTRHRWPPVITAPRGLAPLIPARDVTEEAATDTDSPFHRSAALLAALLHTGHLFAAVASHRWAALSCLTRPREAPHHRAPPTPRTYP